MTQRLTWGLLIRRLEGTSRWLKEQNQTRSLSVGFFGGSTGGAAALCGAAHLGHVVKAVVLRGGRPDLAENCLPYVEAPTLLIVGGYDYSVLELNRRAYDRLSCEKEFFIIPEATHLFEEPGALDEVARLSSRWFLRFFPHRRL